MSPPIAWMWSMICELSGCSGDERDLLVPRVVGREHRAATDDAGPAASGARPACWPWHDRRSWSAQRRRPSATHTPARAMTTTGQRRVAPRRIAAFSRRSGSSCAAGRTNVDLVDLVARPLRADGALDLGCHDRRRRHRRRIILSRSNSVGGEQAGAELAVGGEAHPVAVAAERLGDRSGSRRRCRDRRGSASDRPAPRRGPAPARAGTRRRWRRRSRPGRRPRR